MIMDEEKKYKEHFADFPQEIIDKMLDRQEEVGNPRDFSVFERKIYADIETGGFSWNSSIEKHTFWWNVIVDKLFDVFFKKYPKVDKSSNKFEVGDVIKIVEIVHNGHCLWTPNMDKSVGREFTISHICDDRFMIKSEEFHNGTYPSECAILVCKKDDIDKKVDIDDPSRMVKDEQYYLSDKVAIHCKTLQEFATVLNIGRSLNCKFTTGDKVENTDRWRKLFDVYGKNTYLNLKKVKTRYGNINDMYSVVEIVNSQDFINWHYDIKKTSSEYIKGMDEDEGVGYRKIDPIDKLPKAYADSLQHMNILYGGTEKKKKNEIIISKDQSPQVISSKKRKHFNLIIS